MTKHNKNKSGKKKSSDFDHKKLDIHQEKKKQESSAKVENQDFEHNNIEKSPLKKQQSKKIDTINVIEDQEEINTEQKKLDLETSEKENQNINIEKPQENVKVEKSKEVEVEKLQEENVNVEKLQKKNKKQKTTTNVEKPQEENVNVEKSTQIQETAKKQDQQKIVKFTWDDTNQDVQLTGNWLNWDNRINLTYKEGKLECNEELPKGTYYFKFIVNGQWLVNHNYQTEMDGSNQNNKIIIE